jgi:hypothetical protein
MMKMRMMIAIRASLIAIISIVSNIKNRLRVKKKSMNKHKAMKMVETIIRKDQKTKMRMKTIVTKITNIKRTQMMNLWKGLHQV